MAITDLVPQGTDPTFEITILDEDGVVVDLATTLEITVRILDEGDNTIQAYQKVASGVFDALGIPTPANGKVELYLNSAQTDAGALGVYTAEVTAQFTNTDFDNNTQDLGFLVENLFVLTPSTTISDS